MQRQTVQGIGWYGVLAIIVGYALVTTNILVVKSLVYQILNLTGSIAIIIEALSKKDTQPVVLNIIWAIIALIGVIGIIATQ